MLEKGEVDKIVGDLEGSTDYAIAKKYKRSAHTIAGIRRDINKMIERKEELAEEENKEDNIDVDANDSIDVDALDKMSTQMEYETGVSPTRAVIEKEKIEKHSQAIIEKAEELIQEESEVAIRARQLIEDERRQVVIDEYYKKTIQPLFDHEYPYKNSQWYTRDMVIKLIKPFENEIINLGNQLNQLKADHQNEIEQAKMRVRYEEDQMRCYVCGQPLSKSHIRIPCPRCFGSGHSIQAR